MKVHERKGPQFPWSYAVPTIIDAHILQLTERLHKLEDCLTSLEAGSSQHRLIESRIRAVKRVLSGAIRIQQANRASGVDPESD